MKVQLDLIQLGQQLFRARQEAEYSIADVTDLLGIQAKELLDAESGESQLSAHQLIQLSRLYEQPMSRFVGKLNIPCRTPNEVNTAVESYNAGLITEGQLMAILDVDRLGVRKIVHEKTEPCSRYSV